MAFRSLIFRVVFVCSCTTFCGVAKAHDGDEPVRPTHASITELSPRPRWTSEGLYSAMGLAPAATLYVDGFNPALRYDFELGMHWVRGRTAVFVGADARLFQVFGRKKPGGGVDGMLTLSHGPLYGRIGAGVMAGIPGSRDVRDAPPSVGGLVGAGLQARGIKLVGRIGVDYDVRLDTTGRMNQTVMLTLRFVFGF
jgi:hypothetical protein